MKSPLPIHRVPREGGDPEASRTVRRLALIWVPACAGNSGVKEDCSAPSHRDSSLDGVVSLRIGLGRSGRSLAPPQILPQGHGQTGLALGFCRTSCRGLAFGFTRLFGHTP